MPAPARSRWTDERMEIFIGRLLRWGVVLSAVIVLAGGVFYLVRHGGERPDYARFRGEPSWTRQPAEFWRALGHASGQAWIELGLLLLIATPVARVALSVVLFLLEGDRLYVLLTLAVLAILVYSLWFSG